MAVTFDAVGPSSSGFTGTASASSGTTTWNHTIAAGATHLLVWFCLDQGVVQNSCTCSVTGPVSLTAAAANPLNNNGQGNSNAFYLANPPTGTVTITLSWNMSSTPGELTGGSMSFLGSGALGTPVTISGTHTGSSVTLTVPGVASTSMVAAFIGIGDPPVSPSVGTNRFQANGAGGGGASNGNAEGATNTGTGSVSVTWSGLPSGDTQCGWAVEVQAPGAPPTPVSPLPEPPGWFPGSDRVTSQPEGIPFAQPPPQGDASYPIIIPPPQVLPALPQYPQPPGWFPGADGLVTTEPGGIPFVQPPPQGDASPPLIAPYIPQTTQLLPIQPPGWFPGSDAVVSAPGGIPFNLPKTLPYADVYQPGPSTISGISPDGLSFVDQYGTRKFFVNEDVWGLIANSGRWTSGNYQYELAQYCATRSAQGYNCFEVEIFSNNDPGDAFVYTDGRDWDGTWPFNSTQDPSSGFNPTFWARRDYMFAIAAQYGMAVQCNLTTTGASGNPWTYSFTTAQWQSYGTQLGQRYASTPNILWIMGDDYFGNIDANLHAFVAALRAAGDNHPISVQNYQEVTSRTDIYTGTIYPLAIDDVVQFDWVYTYNVTYQGIILAKQEFPQGSSPGPGQYSPVPVIWGDGFYLNSGTTGITDQNLERRMIWWALSSGASGFATGDNNIYAWGASNMLTLIAAAPFYTSVIPAITSTMEALPKWWTLQPDVNSRFVTSGRGSKTPPIVSGGSGTGYTTNNDSYVTAAITPDGSLAIIYMSHGSTITIDQSQLGVGYTVNWVDPASGATTPATPGSTYNSSSQPSNAASDADWLLIFQGPPVEPVLPVPFGPIAPGWFPGSDSVVTTPYGTPFYVPPVATPTAVPVTIQGTASLQGVGSLTAAATQGAITSLSGAGSITSAVTQVEDSTATILAGAGSLTNAATQGSGGNMGGQGSLTAPDVVQGVIATLGGVGSLTAAVTQGAGATLGGVGQIIQALVTQSVGALLGGTGSVGNTDVMGSGATLAGTGSLFAIGTVITPSTVPFDYVTFTAPGWFPGSDALIANPGGIPWYLPPLGDASYPVATPIISGTASLQGVGSLTAAVTQAVISTLGAAGALTAGVTEAPAATLSGTGVLGDLATQGGGGGLGGQGLLTTAATLGAGATLGGVGSLVAVALVGNFGAATLGGVGSMAASKVTLIPGGPLSGTGSMPGAAVLMPGAVLVGVASLSAAGLIVLPTAFGQAVGAVVATPTVTGNPSVLTPTVTAAILVVPTAKGA